MSTEFLIEPDALYLDGEIRLRLDVTDAAMSRARRSGKLKFSRQGRSFIYRGQWILDWLENDAAERSRNSEKPELVKT